MFESLASCFAFRCSASLNMTMRFVSVTRSIKQHTRNGRGVPRDRDTQKGNDGNGAHPFDFAQGKL